MGGSTAARLHDGRARAGRRGATRLHSPPRGRVAFPNRTRHLLATQPLDAGSRLAGHGRFQQLALPTVRSSREVLANMRRGGMRPRLLKTLKDLKDFIAQAERYGAQPTDEVFYAKYDDDNTLVG